METQGSTLMLGVQSVCLGPHTVSPTSRRCRIARRPMTARCWQHFLPGQHDISTKPDLEWVIHSSW